MSLLSSQFQLGKLRTEKTQSQAKCRPEHRQSGFFGERFGGLQSSVWMCVTHHSARSHHSGHAQLSWLLCCSWDLPSVTSSSCVKRQSRKQVAAPRWVPSELEFLWNTKIDPGGENPSVCLSVTLQGHLIFMEVPPPTGFYASFLSLQRLLCQGKGVDSISVLSHMSGCFMHISVDFLVK